MSQITNVSLLALSNQRMSNIFLDAQLYLLYAPLPVFDSPQADSASLEQPPYQIRATMRNVGDLLKEIYSKSRGEHRCLARGIYALLCFYCKHNALLFLSMLQWRGK
ncbi:hypothetical protein Krac_8507 [Ktedonobacter racemifer DSM 44963]|uniref:Uncharacterized protein n=1 Tax=Ktedonobacter racemifer DSM 44963 TaxID=485913 RepID=D6TN30_KTERA|nr:hypothetical protein Krac_8507 [Ktedonobacter racemifer DSM 44963]